MARAPRSSTAARKCAQDRRRCGSTHSVASRNHRQGYTWMGVRERAGGRWAAEIRVPGSRSRLWIGRFEQALQAALAYDAALFCFYGARRLPSSRRFNFLAAPHPDISEDERAALTHANIKSIAENHARTLASFFAGPPPAISAALASPPAPPPATAVADGAPAAAGERAPTTTNGCNGNCIA